MEPIKISCQDRNIFSAATFFDVVRDLCRGSTEHTVNKFAVAVEYVLKFSNRPLMFLAGARYPSANGIAFMAVTFRYCQADQRLFGIA